MVSISIDQQQCAKDGICTRVCPKGILLQPGHLTIPEIVHKEDCISCGQCVAVCPQGALTHSEFPKGSIHSIDRTNVPNETQVLELLRTRRSIRAFRDKPIDKHIIEQLIEGARFAPSGHNSQSTEYMVVENKATLEQISQLTVNYFKFELKRFSNPFFRALVLAINRPLAESAIHELPTFKKIIQKAHEGHDPVLCNAPALLIFHTRRNEGFAAVNADLALQNASLLAYSLGIGNFYPGYMMACCNRTKHIETLLELPSEHKIFGALALGYPIPKFKQWIERRPAQVTWK